MAIVKFTSENRGDTQTLTWTGLTTGDIGVAWELSKYSDKTAHIFGNFGTTGSVTLYGSNDPTCLTDQASAAKFVLTDPSSTAITKTAAAGEQILENPRFIWPEVILGTTPAITVIIQATKVG